MRASPTRATLRPTLAHFALYRAYLEGLDEATLHAHFGVPGTDVRVTRRTLAKLGDTRRSPRGAPATSTRHT
ncbi:hypothetical protein WJ07_16925 [Burkholderia vietnamiensis]|uniref:hypothetical protein n=1 Tax=Burkholderia vietnamiensis TaxID=60552 RepID=UPI0007547858|nr:hypothetical protein [Burkholderia vietnamiensis]KVF23175.1 hypothetical protein WJ07_16925 [Burkholderia vietnamiensis]